MPSGKGWCYEVIHNWKTGLVRLTEYYQWDAMLVHNCIGHGTPAETTGARGIRLVVAKVTPTAFVAYCILRIRTSICASSFSRSTSLDGSVSP